MITLITGVPGMGKSALVVSMMMRELDSGDRPFFVKGIPDLTLDHSVLPPVEDWTVQRPDPDDPTLFLDYFTFPANSIIVLDEAQRVYRPRASASKVPPHVAAFETHRHTGVDFWLLTQKPHLLDANVRELCGRHIHIRNGLLGRWLYEWPEFTDVKVKANYDTAVKRKFSPPRAAFDKYKSAELHTKQKYRINQVFVVLALVIAFTGYFSKHVYDNFARHGVVGTAVAQKSSVAQKVGLVPGAAGKVPSLSASSGMTEKNPTFSSSVPKSFLNVTLVSDQIDWSKIAACVVMKKECRCYGEEGERLIVPAAACYPAVEYGWAGRPRQDIKPTQNVEHSTHVRAGSDVLSPPLPIKPVVPVI